MIGQPEATASSHPEIILDSSRLRQPSTISDRRYTIHDDDPPLSQKHHVLKCLAFEDVISCLPRRAMSGRLVCSSRNKLFLHLRNHKDEFVLITTRSRNKQKPTLVVPIQQRVEEQVVDTVLEQQGSDTPIEYRSLTKAARLGTGFGYRGQTYATSKVTLGVSKSPEDICVDSGCTVTLIDGR
ncbi:hypothetical protein ACMFMG_008907 [Clarireedia jacksonii]